MIKHIAGGGSSYADALRKSALNIAVKPCYEKCLFVVSNIPSVSFLKEDGNETQAADTSDIDEFKKYLFSGDKGGTIVFSTEVNSVQLSTNPVKNWIVKKFWSLLNKFTVSRFLSKLRQKEHIDAWTIGRYFIGSYTGEDNKTYNESSMSLNVINIDRKTLFALAQEIRSYLKQESVMVHDASNNQIYFVSEDK